MRSILCALGAVVMLTGCVLFTPEEKDVKSDANKKSVPVQEPILVGKVVSVKMNLQFAVLNFPVGSVPPLQQTLNIYRQGVKVGEVKVTGPRQNDNIVGDIVDGEAKPGDEIRSD